jgi:hypothetical protein
VTGFALDSVTVTHGVELSVENLVHAPHLAYAVVSARKSILGAQIEEARKLALYIGPRELPNDTVVHDVKPLFVRVRESSRTKDAPRRPSVCRLGRSLYSEVGIVIKSPVWMDETTAGQLLLIMRAAEDLYAVEATGRKSLGRESEAIGISRVSRQWQRQGDGEPRALKLVTLCPG